LHDNVKFLKTKKESDYHLKALVTWFHCHITADDIPLAAQLNRVRYTLG